MSDEAAALVVFRNGLRRRADGTGYAFRGTAMDTHHVIRAGWVTNELTALDDGTFGHVLTDDGHALASRMKS